MKALLYFALWAWRSGSRGRGEGLALDSAGKDIDPVCGKTVSTDEAKPSVHSGSVYYFRSSECREIFEAAPGKYVGPHAKTPHSLSENNHV